MAPAPKAPGERVRRNRDQPNWRSLPTAPTFKKPVARPKWSKPTKDWWAAIWRSPMATQWLESDVFELLYLGDLMELPKKSAEHYAEIRQLKDRFGLNPKARRALMWNVPLADEGESLEEAVKPSNVRRLRAV
jgi:hypothetical protein